MGSGSSVAYKRCDIRTDPITGNHQPVTRPVRHKGAFPFYGRREASIVANDLEAFGAVPPAFGGNRDESGMIFLVASLNEPVVANLSGGAVGQVDHVVRRMTGGIVEAA